jgi:hypothetical protein
MIVMIIFQQLRTNVLAIYAHTNVDCSENQVLEQPPYNATYILVKVPLDRIKQIGSFDKHEKNMPNNDSDKIVTPLDSPIQ